MGDVHGRKREKTTEELMKARKEKEAVKITEYNLLVKQCQQKMFDKTYNQEAFSLTTRIVNWNPEFYTIWNYRRDILLNFVLQPGQEEENQKVFKEELLLFMQLIRMNPKSYWLWNHRFWCLQNMPKPDWNAELGLVDKMLSMDARNFHGWNYRQYVVGHLRKTKNEQDNYKLVESEYQFTTKMICQSFSNYSAWHQRSKLLPEVVAPMTTEEKNEVARNELDLVKNAIYTEPDDQSAWLYYRWILGRVSDAVELIGAYQLKDTPFIILAFNDIVRMRQMPSILNGKNEPLEGNMYPIPEKDEKKESSSIWVYSLTNQETEACQVIISSDAILPSGSGRIGPKDIWNVQIQQIERGPNTHKRMKTIVSSLESRGWTPTSSKIYNDPTTNEHVSWFTLDKTQLLIEEINTVRDLLDLEPESAWALQTLVHFLSQLVLRTNNVNKDEIYTEIISKLDLLMEIDTARKHRYEDQRSWFLFQKITQTTSDLTKTVEVLDLGLLTDIPLLSKLLLVPKIIVSSKKAQNVLSNLPLLDECTLKV
ncbi:hypothetical protein G6F57_002067 [Rhizopus arrhizus]|uniref:Geranylgeranyl transferase type-2 subunit alpha n=1 Tax=Rhizopus oryzae TaxID=64495 RepID=A0A9P6XJV4_RHIOR|nr:hypothetical protein G6F23_000471 [Rhizopus arrhizus]KAG1428977.1 hypothetical protein G6F58_000283 [Rhizopus delemar]KAG0768611.1 hypothetical protein G6F24_001792 [Rhizopus arrhizus]KAG0795143.1 hypothetical protein G6F21_002333 [Rhizopus arrhizus]KAG0819410.1 hypothetical protein G6F20_000794 [Rhizopus arrhizus]